MFIRISEAAEALSVRPSTIRRLIRQRMVTTRKLPGGIPLVLAEDVERLAAESTVPALRQGAK